MSRVTPYDHTRVILGAIRDVAAVLSAGAAESVDRAVASLEDAQRWEEEAKAADHLADLEREVTDLRAEVARLRAERIPDPRQVARDWLRGGGPDEASVLASARAVMARGEGE